GARCAERSGQAQAIRSAATLWRVRGRGSGRKRRCAGAGGVDFDLSDLGSFGGLGDLFSTIFGRRGTSGAERLDDEDEIETTVSIPFRVAALGGKVPVTLPMAEVCPTCNG